MGTLSARNLRDSLQKAKGVGLVEERFVIGDVDVAVRSLRPDEYAAIVADCKGFDDIAYLNAFQKGHVSRALVELNGQDFRDVDFVDDEEPDPKKPGQMKPVKLEIYKWLEKNVIDTWGKEVLYVVYRKVGDAVDKAEKQAQEGIQFLTPDETAEEKYRRLLGDLIAAQDDVASGIVEKILDDNGFMLKTTAEEAKRAMEAAGAIAREQIAREKAAAEAAEAAVQVQVHVPMATPPQVQAPVAPPPQARTPSPEDLMRNREPLNMTSRDVNTAPGKPPQNVIPAVRGPAPPPPANAVPAHMLQTPAVTSKGSQYAALEADAEANVGAPIALGPPRVEVPSEKPTIVLDRGTNQIDPKGAMSIINQPPKGGLNPHFRAPRKP